LTEENPDENRESQRILGWPPPPKMQILLILGVCVMINIVLIGVWLLVIYLR